MNTRSILVAALATLCWVAAADTVSAQTLAGCTAESAAPGDGPGAAAGAVAATAATGPVIHLTGDVGRPITLGAADLERLPRHRIQVDDRGVPAEFEGVPLLEIMRVAGVPVESLRGAQAATILVTEASDGYRTAYSLAELDPAFSGRLFILADRRDGGALGEGEGPFRVVAEGETRRSRWIRSVQCLRVVRF